MSESVSNRHICRSVGGDDEWFRIWKENWLEFELRFWLWVCLIRKIIVRKKETFMSEI